MICRTTGTYRDKWDVLGDLVLGGSVLPIHFSIGITPSMASHGEPLELMGGYCFALDLASALVCPMVSSLPPSCLPAAPGGCL